MAYESDVLLDRPGGTGIASNPVVFKKIFDGSTLTGAYASVQTDGSGRFEVDTNGHPGPILWEATVSPETWHRESESTGLAGSVSLGELFVLCHAFEFGVVPNYLNGLQVTTAPSGLNVRVRNGAALPTVIYRQPTDLLTVGPFDAVVGAGNSRIDTVVVRGYPHGVAQQGRCELAIVKGVDATAPTAPALTQSLATFWETPLANIRLAFGDTVIAATAITDRRPIIDVPITDPTLAGEPWKTATFEDHLANSAQWSSGGQGSLSIVSVVGRYGVLQMQTTGANGDRFRINHGPAATSPVIRNGLDFDLTLICAPITTITNVDIQIGLADDWSQSTPSNGIWFQFDPSVDASWNGVTRSGGVESVLDLTGTVAAGALDRLRIRRVGSTVYFSVNGGTEKSQTANLPSTSLQEGANLRAASAETKFFLIDYVRNVVTGLS